VDVSPENCWDCPVPLFDVLLQFAIMAVLVALGARMQRADRQVFRGLGWMLTVVALFFAAIYTIVIPRWGISTSNVPLAVWPRRTSWLILAVLDSVLAGIALLARRSRGIDRVSSDAGG
jgi:hypothetical protein